LVARQEHVSGADRDLLEQRQELNVELGHEAGGGRDLAL
jgi:hypothetical protein